MTVVDINDFSQEKQCTYKGERYSVRDNGAVLRHPPEGECARPNDNHWTFGKENSANPYLHISNVRIHRIVATAFHGEPPDHEHVVDHIDTNCRNNRPENLRWLSRLENSLKNPVTRKKIEYLCGSIEAFLENPSMLNDLQSNPNFKWMRTVTPEEAKNCRVRMSLWADADNKPARPTGTAHNKRSSAKKVYKPLQEREIVIDIGGVSIGIPLESQRSAHEIETANPNKSSFAERVYKPLKKWEVGLDGEPGLELSSTPRCAAYMMRATYFPCCPQKFGDDPLEDYFQNIKIGALFAYSDHDDYPKHTVVESVILKKKSSILVICETTNCKWSIIGIELHQSSNPKHFIHFNLGSYYSKDEADKALIIKKELDHFWNEGYKNYKD